MSRLTKFLIGLAVFVVVATVFVFVSTPNAYSAETWRIKNYRGGLNSTTRQQQSFTLRTVRLPASTGPVYCRSARMRVQGGNWLDRSIVRGHGIARWCWAWQDKEIIDFRFQYDGDADGWALWSYEGLASLIKGHGINDGGYEYYYRRARFHFKRGIGSFAQHVYPWVSLTVKATGGCWGDRIDNNERLRCS